MNRPYIYSIQDHDQIFRLLQQGIQVNLVYEGSDMLPFIRGEKDIVTLRGIDSRIRRGDIVLVSDANGACKLRRVVDHNQNRLYLWADSATEMSDCESCTLNNIVGRVVNIKRGSRIIHPGRRYLWMLLLPLRRPFLAVFCWLHKINME